MLSRLAALKGGAGNVAVPCEHGNLIETSRSPSEWRDLFVQRRARQPAHAAECGLCSIEPKTEIVIGVRAVAIRRLMIVRVPPGADLHAALVLAHAQRRRVIFERRRVGI